MLFFRNQVGTVTRNTGKSREFGFAHSLHLYLDFNEINSKNFS